MEHHFGLLWHSDENVHPDDRDKLFQKIATNTFISYIVRDFDGEYAKIQILPDKELYRILPSHITKYPKSRFEIGNHVLTKTKPIRDGWIRLIYWHGEKGCHIYFLSVSNKIGGVRKSNCWYFDEDLELLNG